MTLQTTGEDTTADELGPVDELGFSFPTQGHLSSKIFTLSYTECFPGKLQNLYRVIPRFNMILVSCIVQVLG